MAAKIAFIKSQSNFRGEIVTLREDKLFDTSYRDCNHAIGHLRFPGVSNGRYESKHPIFDLNGDKVGFLVNGAGSLGYTYHCVYVDRAECFYISHSPFGSSKSYISIVSENGSFLFTKGVKFERTQTFELPGACTNILTFKLIEDQRYLLVLTQYGFCLIDTVYRKLASKTLFEGMGYSVTGFALSPKVNLLAIAFCVPDYKDPLDGEYRYRNLIHIYDLEIGQSIGSHYLEINELIYWKLAFSTDGRQLAVNSENCDLVFDLDARR